MASGRRDVLDRCDPRHRLDLRRSARARWPPEVPSSSWAVTATLLSMKARPALRPLITMKSAASRTSISTTVAVAARLIIALRQKPCQARTIVKPMKRRNPIDQYSRSYAAAASSRTRWPSSSARHASSHRVDDLLVVRRHQHRRAELVDLDQQLDDPPARDRVEVPRGLIGDEDRRVVDERSRDRGPLLLAARELGRQVVGVILEADEAEQLWDTLANRRRAGHRSRRARRRRSPTPSSWAAAGSPGRRSRSAVAARGPVRDASAAGRGRRPSPARASAAARG